MKWHIHKWYYINGREYDYFHGRQCPREWDKYRVCVKCGMAQEFKWYSGGGYRDYLSDCKAEVLRDKIVNAEKACGRVVLEKEALKII